MIRRVLLCVTMLSAACSTPPARPSLSVLVPADLQTCPDGAQPPPVPKAPRSVPEVVTWGSGNYFAWIGSERARAACQRRLIRLNQWIDYYFKTGKIEGS